MDDRAIKRLLIIFVISLIAIFLFKMVISRTIVNLNRIVIEKKQSAVKSHTDEQITPATSGTAVIVDSPPISNVGEGTPVEPPSVSGVGISN